MSTFSSSPLAPHDDLVSDRKTISRLKKTFGSPPIEHSTAQEMTEAESEGLGLVMAFLGSLSTPRPTSFKHDIKLIKKILNAIVEAAEDDVLTPKEVDLLLNFFAGRFVQRRVDRMVQKTFEPSSHWHCSFRGFKSSSE